MDVDDDAVLRSVAQVSEGSGLSAAAVDLLAENELDVAVKDGLGVPNTHCAANTSNKARRTGRTRDGGPTRNKFTGAEDAHVPVYIRSVKSGALLGSLMCACATLVHGSCKRGLTISTLEKAAEKCYGNEAVVSDGRNITVGGKQAPQRWFELVHACRKEDTHTGQITIDYRLSGVPVCGRVFAGAYGISESTFDQIECKVLAGKHAWRDGLPRSRIIPGARSALSLGPSTLFVAATTWWLGLFLCFDCTTKKGKIMYDVRNWNSTYVDEFIPTMHALGHMWRVPTTTTRVDTVGCSDDGAIDDTDTTGSKGMWYRARKHALQRFADTEYHVGSEPFQLIERRKL